MFLFEIGKPLKKLRKPEHQSVDRRENAVRADTSDRRSADIGLFHQHSRLLVKRDKKHAKGVDRTASFDRPDLENVIGVSIGPISEILDSSSVKFILRKYQNDVFISLVVITISK